MYFSLVWVGFNSVRSIWFDSVIFFFAQRTLIIVAVFQKTVANIASRLQVLHVARYL